MPTQKQIFDKTASLIDSGWPWEEAYWYARTLLENQLILQGENDVKIIEKM